MSEALSKLLEQAEVQKLQMELNLRFQKNLALFQKRFPSAYEKIKSHTPDRLILQLDPNRNLNLADKKEMVYMYSEAANKYAQKLIQAFRNNPQLHRFKVVKSREQNPKHLHIRNLNKLIDIYNDDKVERITDAPHYLSNLIVSGVGLGYHLVEAVRSFDIQNILIYEHSLDAVHGSMHVIDWEEVVNHFDNDNKSISLCIGIQPLKALEQIENVIQNVGLHSQIYNFVLMHGQRESEKEFINLYINEIRSFIGGLGYFDDERIGLAHAYHNLRSEHSVFKTPKSYNRKTRALIIGNGPSLDEHEEYLKANEDKVVLVSCGTALTTLLRMGVKPDFHVEMERPSFIHEVLNYGSTQEQRKGITLLCLHSVSPTTTACFEEACYAIKPNDAGTSLILDFCKNTTAPQLPFSNPTVTNCALAFLVCMGFSEIHLVGVDLGAVDEKQHHSSKSLYYDFEKYNETHKTKIKKPQAQNIQREGNFGGTVSASAILDMSRSSMERLLALVKSTFPAFICYNTNNGVKIKHTESIRLDDLPKVKNEDKQSFITKLKHDHFHKVDSKKLNTHHLENHFKYFFSIKTKILLSDNIDSEKGLLTQATRAYLAANKTKDSMTHFLLRGTLNCFLGAIIENCMYCKKREDFKKRVSVGVTIYNQLIEDIYQRMRDNPTEIDDTISATLNKMISDGWSKSSKVESKEKGKEKNSEIEEACK